jgi:hypothetical protein
MEQEEDSLLPSTPWWFETLIRDGSGKERKYNLHAFWHWLVSKDPPLSFCTIEKVATTQWRQVFAQLKDPTCTTKEPVEPDCCAYETQECFEDNWDEIQGMKNYSSIVFIRDPLERFLSAYLNKCESSQRDRQWCKPTAVFEDFDNRMLVDLTKRERFSAFVDVVPLHWDLHFFPQSLYCDGLFRNIDTYDFVGKMDTEFYQYLEGFVRHADSKSSEKARVGKLVNKIFKIKGKTEQENQGTETKAPSQVLAYYTPRTVRRVLEYTALVSCLTILRWCLSCASSNASYLLGSFVQLIGLSNVELDSARLGAADAGARGEFNVLQKQELCK